MPNRPNRLVWLLITLLLPGLACAGLGDPTGPSGLATGASTSPATLTAQPTATTVQTATTVPAIDSAPAQIPAATVSYFWTPGAGGRAPTDEIGGSGNFQLGRAVLSRDGVLFMLSGETRIFSYHFGAGATEEDTLFATGADFSDIALGPDDTLFASSRLTPVITVFDSGGAISETIALPSGTAPVMTGPRQRLLVVPSADNLFVLDVPSPDSEQALLLRRFNRRGELLSWTDQLPLIVGARGLVHDEDGQLFMLPAIGSNLARFLVDGTPAGQIRVNLADGAAFCAVSAAGQTLFLVTSTPHGVLRLNETGQLIDFLNLEETAPVDIDWPEQQRCLVRGIAASGDGQTIYLTLFPTRWDQAVDHVIGYRYE